MPQPKDLDPYTDARSFYGSELRRLREAAGLSQSELGDRVFCSGTYIGLFEMAERRPQEDMSRAFDELLGSGEHLQRLCRLARKSKVASYFADAAELEKRARSIEEYAPMLMPGVLQTRAYATALTRGTMRRTSDEGVERTVSARMERAQLFSCENRPDFWAIIHEAALRVPIGGLPTMRDQLAHLVETARAHPHAILQVLPFSAGFHPFLNTMSSLMQFADAPPVVYTEGAYTGQLVEEAALVAQYRSAYDLARAVALSPEASLALIASAAKDCDR
ncbi:helix-turn-helix transcriptional regulator [Streptomyces sp. Ncost-T10-10d]|uniref:helix-turn-helix domain-containing protein n=1 Tax=Streptomyces sp. Ncost-T10-10d TaxID=1839774 RepID=UPI00081DFFC6|nr:helix-turn-helix transcriptional regulator [Streptomyces sp. Ncost-T10-10d]SCF56757.1 Helix-turn-helix domain-containing protein [Streptomyces sp. Ncost-T10-10d]